MVDKIGLDRVDLNIPELLEESVDGFCFVTVDNRLCVPACCISNMSVIRVSGQPTAVCRTISTDT